MPSWKVQSIQASWWPSGLVDAGTLFVAVTGQAAANVQKSPMPPVEIAIGQIGTSIIRVQAAQNRIDLIETAANTPSGLPLIDNAKHALRDFSDKCLKVDVGDIARASVVFTVSEPCASEESASQKAALYSGHNPSFSNGVDFILQINRRKALGSNGLNANRIMKWLSEKFQSFDFSSGFANLREANVVSWQIDVNTVPSTGIAFSAKDQHSIFADLFAEVERLFDAGDQSGLD